MTAAAKFTARMIAALLVIPLVVIAWLFNLAGGDAFPACSQFLSLLPGKTGSYLRLAFYRFLLPECGGDAFMGFGTLLSQRDTYLGERIYIGPQCNIGSCRIGNDTLVASGVHIMSGTGQHNFDNPELPIREQGGEYRCIEIGEDCWIGNGAMVMANIGDKSIIGAGAVVTQAIPCNSIAVGNPARVVRQRHEKATGA